MAFSGSDSSSRALLAKNVCMCAEWWSPGETIGSTCAMPTEGLQNNLAWPVAVAGARMLIRTIKPVAALFFSWLFIGRLPKAFTFFPRVLSPVRAVPRKRQFAAPYCGDRSATLAAPH